MTYVKTFTSQGSDPARCPKRWGHLFGCKARATIPRYDRPSPDPRPRRHSEQHERVRVLRPVRRTGARRGPRAVRRATRARAAALLPGMPAPDGRPGGPTWVDGPVLGARDGHRSGGVLNLTRRITHVRRTTGRGRAARSGVRCRQWVTAVRMSGESASRHRRCCICCAEYNEARTPRPLGHGCKNCRHAAIKRQVDKTA